MTQNLENSSPKRARRGRGEGGVSWSETHACWVGSLSLGHAANGCRRRRYVYGKTKREVIEALARLRASVAGGLLPDATMSVGDLLERWLAVGAATWSPSTLENRADTIRLHITPRMGRQSLGKLNVLHIESFHAELLRDRVGPYAIRHAARCLDAALNYAVLRRLIATNPAANVEPPAPPHREMTCLDASQVRLLLAAALPLPCYPILALALATGCRQGELLGLYWGDIDLARGRLSVQRTLLRTKKGTQLKEPKTRASKRTICLPPDLAFLRAHREQQQRRCLLAAPVFCSASGAFLWRRNLLRSLRAVIDRVNDPDRNRAGGRPDPHAAPAPPRQRLHLIPDGLRFHDLRHTVASLLLSAGCSLRAVSARLGHSSPSFTLSRYGHVLPGDDDALAARLGRDLFA